MKKWISFTAFLGLSVGCLVGGYYLGDKNATESVLEALEATCGRTPTIMQLPSGTMAACMPLHQQPNVEEKYQKGLDKSQEV